jgi:hypothetical protein
MTTNKNPVQKKGGLATSLNVFVFWRKTIMNLRTITLAAWDVKTPGLAARRSRRINWLVRA